MRKRNVSVSDLQPEAFVELQGTITDIYPVNNYMHVYLTLDGTDTTLRFIIPKTTKLKEVIIND